MWWLLYLDVLFNFTYWRWYRRLRGGRWELWYVECCRTDIWHRISDYDRDPRSWYSVHGRPTPVCRGIPTVEEW